MTFLKEGYLKRFIEFHKNFPIKVIFISDVKIKSSLEKHKYYKFVSNDFHKKLLFSLGKAKTKYIIWIGDDDFINFRSLKHTLMFLKK